MAVIPGVIPVTGFIGPTDDEDVYAVTDARYGVDGLRNEADSTARNAIPFERRRTGMIVGTQNDLKYWKLLPPTVGSPASDWTYTNSDWDLAFDLSGGPVQGGGSGISVFAVLSSPAPSGSPEADEYYGISGSPGIQALNVNAIYLVTFDTNNNGPVRLDVDGEGLLEITKASTTGPVPLDADDIAADVVYAVVYNGINFQLLGGSSSSGLDTLIKDHLVAGDNIIVSADYQYLVYGNLTIDAGASLINYGKVIIINGALVNNGNFDNFGTIQLVTLELDQVDFGVKEHLVAGDDITVEPNYQYLVYGDLTIDLGAIMTNNGHIVIINGSLIQNGTFTNNGTIDFVDLLLDTGGPLPGKYVEPATAYLANVVNTITHGLGTGNEIFITIVDTINNEEVNAVVDNFATNSVDITFSQNVTAKIIIRS